MTMGETDSRELIRTALRGREVDVEDLVRAVRLECAIYEHWSREVEDWMLERIREALPDFEHSLRPSYDRDDNPSFEHLEPGDLVYVRWQNGPDLYALEYVVRAVSHEMIDYTWVLMLCEAMGTWTRIRKKTRGDAARAVFDVDAYIDGLDGNGRASLSHFVDGLVHDHEWDHRFRELLAQDPEALVDIYAWFRRRRLGAY